MWRLLQVAYMDPGNWATAIEAGSRFGYQLVSTLAAHMRIYKRSLAVSQQRGSSQQQVTGVMLQESLRFM
jgi:hypothetical protein